MSRTRVRRRRLAATVTAVGVAVTLTAPKIGPGEDPESQAVSLRSHVVQQGETLWSIASRIVGDADPRPLVDAIARSNDVSPGRLMPGQTLVIPSSA
ncbi:MAG: LysM peptidoglycan-binding domain-containing protein [Actinomycetota bacterium]